jgi:hypothetical protein
MMWEHPIGKRDRLLVFDAIMKLGKPKVHDIKKWLDSNSIQPLDKDPVSVIDYYNTRDGELDDKVITDIKKPTNILPHNDPKAYPKTMSRQTIHFHCKGLTHDGYIQYDNGRYSVPDRVRNELRLFGTWFGEVAVSRLFSGSVTGMTEFINRIGVYMVYVFIEAMAPFLDNKVKTTSDMLAIEWIESAIPIKTMFWKFVQCFKGLEVVRRENKGKPAYELDIKKINELESKLKKLYPDIYRSLLETKGYMNLDRNKRSVTRQRPGPIRV